MTVSPITLGIDLAALQRVCDENRQPVIYAGARIDTADPVIGTVSRGDLLVAGGRIVGVGPGLTTAAEDDDAYVVDLSGAVILPVAVDLLARAGHRDRAGILGSLAPGQPASFVVAAGVEDGTSAVPETLRLPQDAALIVSAGRPIAARGAWLTDESPVVDPLGSTGVDDARVGVWVDETGFLEQELRADGRYDETRGGRPHAYEGRYWIDGDRIDYLDDLGFWAFGEFHGEVLDHAGYRMRQRGA